LSSGSSFCARLFVEHTLRDGRAHRETVKQALDELVAEQQI
jgi:hypothetical protein